MGRPSHIFVEPDGAIVATAGYPNDGQDYVDIDVMSDTNGQRVVWWCNGHEWGYAISDPISGAHLSKVQQDGWAPEERLRKMSTYWIRVVPDEVMPRHLVGEHVAVLVPIHHAWLVGLLPSPRPTA